MEFIRDDAKIRRLNEFTIWPDKPNLTNAQKKDFILLYLSFVLNAYERREGAAADELSTIAGLLETEIWKNLLSKKATGQQGADFLRWFTKQHEGIFNAGYVGELIDYYIKCCFEIK